MKGSVKLPVFIDDARKYVNTTQLRAKYLGASYEAEYCQWQTLHGLGSLMETASLIITPNAYLEGKLIASYPPDPIGDFDVTRATTATRVNSAGLVELVSYNLFNYSQKFDNAYWIKSSSTVTADNTTAPDGTTTADKMTITAGFGAVYASSIPLEGTHTISCFFKKGDASSVYIDTNGTSGNIFGSLNLDTLATSSVGGAIVNVENAGNGWYRLSITASFTGTTSYIAFGILSASSNLFTYLWGAQLVEGSTAKDYQKTETRLNIPRLDYSNGTCPSLLVEPQRTNLLTYSSSFDNAAWTKSGVTATANDAIAPDGTLTADKLVFSGSGKFIYQQSATSGQCAHSIYIKGTAGQTISLDNTWALDPANVFTLNGEWQRFDFTSTTSGGQGQGLAISTFQSATATTIWVWGAQLELGSYSSSFIPTTSASVTRNADVISKTGISSLIGQTEGTLFVDAYITGKDSSNGSILFATDKVSSGALIRIIYTPTNALRFDVFDGSSFQCLISAGAYNVGDRVKVAGGYKNNDFVMYVNGTQIGIDTSGSVPATDTANINTSIYGDTNGSFVNAAALWTTRLTNTQLAQLTTI